MALGAGVGAGAGEGLRELTPKELESYPFEIEEEPPEVTALSIGQRWHLRRQREEAATLFARHLGILSLKGDQRDLASFQALIDKQVISDADTQRWQSLGVAFGDLLANAFDLHWISYEDDLGASKALRYKETENYVFPVTLLSKRVQFKEDLDIHRLYQALAKDIAAFQARAAAEAARPAFN